MTKYLLSMAAAVAFSLNATAAEELTRLPAGAFSDVSVERSVSSLLVKLTIHPDVFPKRSNREVWLSPAIVAGDRILLVDSVVVAGRTRYYQHLRGNYSLGTAPLLRAGSSEPYSYELVVPYQSWMDVSDFTISSRVSGCAGCHVTTFLEDPPLYKMDFREKNLNDVTMVYVSPTKEIVKTRTVNGKAYIDFPVGKSVIDPTYRRNPAELNEIRRTIDDVRADRDVSITSISFKGYASPEGSYASNEKLAEARTEALIDYVRKLYEFPESVMHASWVAEDWEGLAAQVKDMNIDRKDAILALIDDDSLTPDQKDEKLKKDFPNEYYILLTQVYPSLRRTDYDVSFQVRSYTDVAEIAAVMAKSPQKLSLDELYLYAQSLDKDSPEFKEVMEVAVRMFPDDPEANLNAAATAVASCDTARAREYLKKAKNCPEALYTEGLLEAKEGNYPRAAELLQQAASGGVKEAAEVLQRMRDFSWIN